MAQRLTGFGYTNPPGANPNIPLGVSLTPEAVQQILALQNQYQVELQARKLRRAMWVLCFVTAWGSFWGSVWLAAVVALPFIGLAGLWLTLSYILYLGLTPTRK